MTLNRFGIGMLTARIVMFCMLFLEFLVSVSHDRYFSLFLTKVKLVWNQWKGTQKSRSIRSFNLLFELICNLLFLFLQVLKYLKVNPSIAAMVST